MQEDKLRRPREAQQTSRRPAAWSVGGNEEGEMEEGREATEEWMCVSKVARSQLLEDVATHQTTHTHILTLRARSHQNPPLVIVAKL